ncbi:hypothetical protein SXCC_02194 [Gluconacetobacter sp. SXCC-1]|nr:hypothetical protein SXCC_02194 [Gluconacetobacter sp. SXCC-1]
MLRFTEKTMCHKNYRTIFFDDLKRVIDRSTKPSYRIYSVFLQ